MKDTRSDDSRWKSIPVALAVVTAIAAVVVAVPVVVGWFQGDNVEAPQPKTEIILIAPFTPEGAFAPGVRAIGSSSGSCGVSSVSDRTDAVRCFTDEYIYDPCIVGFPGFPDPALCVIDPFSREFVLVRDRDESDNDGFLGGEYEDWVIDTGESEPFALLLESGEKCYRLTGTVAFAPGSVGSHLCESGVYLVVPIDRSSALWRIRLWSSSNSQLEWVTIAAAAF